MVVPWVSVGYEEISDLHEARDPKRKPQIDTVRWIFLAFAVAITAAAEMVAYKANDTMVANGPNRREP
jgi:hypothetical protein